MRESKTPLSTVLAGGRVLLPGGDVVVADLGLADGRIAALGGPGALAAEEEVDIRGLLVMPGVVDAHIHLGHGADISRPRVPADATTESAAAAKGGVTTFLSYLISDQAFEKGLLDEVIAVAEAGARVDFGFHLVLSTEEQLAAVPLYKERYGVPSFKIFMYNRGGEGRRLGLPDIDDGFLFRLLEAARDCRGIVCPHCENIEVAWVLRDRLVALDPNGEGGLGAWHQSR